MSSQQPGLLRLFASLVYDGLLVLALLFVATFLFVVIVGEATHPPLRYFLQLYLWCVAGLYFSWCWARGRTLAMQAWKINLVSVHGGFMSVRQALQRYLLATAGLLVFGVGFWWVLIDREHRFLHDRLMSSRLVMQT